MNNPRHDRHEESFSIDFEYPERLVCFPSALPEEARKEWEQENNLGSTGYSRYQNLVEKYNLARFALCILIQTEHDEEYVIDLGVWASKFSWIRTIHVDPVYREGIAGSYRVVGFENYPHLESLSMDFALSSRHEPQFRCSTENLHGIEYCSNLKALSIRGNQITDLSPISSLEIKTLDVYSTPISSFSPVNFSCLNLLTIDPSQIDLICDEHDLSSLRILRIHCYSAEFQLMMTALMNHPTIARLEKEYGFTIVRRGVMIFCKKHE